jgi:hypothetical protein
VDRQGIPPWARLCRVGELGPVVTQAVFTGKTLSIRSRKPDILNTACSDMESCDEHEGYSARVCDEEMGIVTIQHQ